MPTLAGNKHFSILSSVIGRVPTIFWQQIDGCSSSELNIKVLTPAQTIDWQKNRNTSMVTKEYIPHQKLKKIKN